MFKKVIECDLIIPQFDYFTKELNLIFNQVKNDPSYTSGEVASYIPALARANPEYFATSFCSINGQFT